MNELLDLHPQKWNLLVLPGQYHNRLLVAMAHVAMNSPLIVLDCGRQFDASIVARAAQDQEPGVGESAQNFLGTSQACVFHQNQRRNAQLIQHNLVDAFGFLRTQV